MTPTPYTMDNEKTGGPAYPYKTEEWGVDSTGEKVLVDIKEPGMTLLDHFAGLAMQALIAKAPWYEIYNNQQEDAIRVKMGAMSSGAYAYAYAMIAERNRLMNP
jgi:hypothetical protein